VNYLLENLILTEKSLMIYDEKELIYSSNKDGIRPHLDAIELLGDKLHGKIMVDKIVGRAAALLMLYSQAREIHALVLSSPAKKVLEGKVEYVYNKLVDQIKTRDGRIYCPFEKMVQNINDPIEAYYIIQKKMASFKNNS
jgi:hypothetical protein